MENLGLNVMEALGCLCRVDGRCATSGCQELLSKQIWTPRDRRQLLSVLSELLLNRSSTVNITRTFRAVILDLLSRARSHVENTHDPKQRYIQHQRFCVALSKVIKVVPETTGWILSYLSTTEPFYKPFPGEEFGEPAVKKIKKKADEKPSQNELVIAACTLVSHLHHELRVAWDWSDLITYLDDPDSTKRWFAACTIAKLTAMSPQCLQDFRRQHFTEEEIIDLSIRCDDNLAKQQERVQLLGNPVQSQKTIWHSEKRTHTLKEILDADLSSDVSCICGVLLPRKQSFPQDDDDGSGCLVMVPSVQRNLRCLALAVAAGLPVLLEGHVGCGKTSLVEHLAMITGRRTTPHLMKIQLGEQTDSKALVGVYRCTEVPGEFIWQPGVLTTAVQEGHWVLLEDLDYAPVDVISLLLPLLESRTLSIPGHGDQIQAHPDFRIFATLRLLGHSGSLYRQQNAGMDIIDKLWTHVIVEPLSRKELHQVIVHKHPQLENVVDKLLDIYFLLSSGRHDPCHGDCPSDNLDKNDDSSRRAFSLDGRMVSTRDLIKWCSRIAVDFDGTKTSTAMAVFHEALDCFCVSMSKSDSQLALAEAIGAKLNITKAKTEYMCSKYKPDVEITATLFQVGRATLARKLSGVAKLDRSAMPSFAFTRQSVNLLERVAVCVHNNEPVLLVGETGTGKTSSVQYLAKQLGHKLRVINMNQQSDSTDLLGGFKPVDIRFIVAPFREEFELIFCSTFSQKQNGRFLGHIQECFNKRKWLDLFKLMEHTMKSALNKTSKGPKLHKKWENLATRLRQLQIQVKQSQSALAFAFIEGTLIRALKAGDWVLLDEINLAAAETLECLSGLLDSSTGSVVLMERGDTKPVVRHPDFRLFACMNPATDVGKKDLPPGVRNRFTELYVNELEDAQDLKILVAEYLKGLSVSSSQIDGIVKFYLTIRGEASRKLVDGTGHKPCYRDSA